MTIDNIFQYVMKDGMISGIIIADSLQDAMLKLETNVKKRYAYTTEEELNALVWCIKDNSGCEDDVYEIMNQCRNKRLI